MPKTNAPSTTFGIITAVLTLLGWASVPLFLRHFAQSIDPWTSNGWRYGFSALVWAPVLMLVMYNGKLPRGLWKAAIVPSIVNAAGQVCFTYAHYCIKPGLLTFGLRSQLLFVAIGAWILFPSERRIIGTRGYIIGAVVLLTGTGAVLLLDEGEASGAAAGLAASSAPTAHLAGILLAIAAGLLFASYGLAVRKYMHGFNSVIAFAAICQFTALALVGLMLALGNRAGLTALDMDGPQMSLLLLSALIGIAFGHMFYYMSIARLGVAVTAGVLQLQPVFVAIASLWLFGEVLNAGQWAGGFLALGGAMLMLWVQWRLSRQVPKVGTPVAIAEGESGS